MGIDLGVNVNAKWVAKNLKKLRLLLLKQQINIGENLVEVCKSIANHRFNIAYRTMFKAQGNLNELKSDVEIYQNIIMKTLLEEDNLSHHKDRTISSVDKIFEVIDKAKKYANKFRITLLKTPPDLDGSQNHYQALHETCIVSLSSALDAYYYLCRSILFEVAILSVTEREKIVKNEERATKKILAMQKEIKEIHENLAGYNQVW